ncbi:MAG: hypothetical protein AB1489_31380 [Acidobacteriota bacterium]
MHNLNSIDWRRYLLNISITVSGTLLFALQAELSLKSTLILVAGAFLKDTHSFLTDARRKFDSNEIKRS